MKENATMVKCMQQDVASPFYHISKRQMHEPCLNQSIDEVYAPTEVFKQALCEDETISRVISPSGGHEEGPTSYGYCHGGCVPDSHRTTLFEVIHIVAY